MMLDEFALKYEFFISGIFECKRSEDPARLADADIFNLAAQDNKIYLNMAKTGVAYAIARRRSDYINTKVLEESEDYERFDRIVFAGYRKNVKEILHAVDAFVFPSLQEGLPVSLMEAMAVGLPVVCSRIRGNVDLIEDGKGGWLAECHDVDGFVEGMRKVYKDSSIGLQNIITMGKFDVSNVNKEMMKIYRMI